MVHVATMKGATKTGYDCPNILELRSLAGLSTLDKFLHSGQIVRPKQCKAASLCLLQITDLEYAGQHRNRYDLVGTELSMPNSGFHGCIIVDAFNTVGGAVGDLALYRHKATIEQTNRNICLPTSYQRFPTEFALFGGISESVNDPRTRILEPHIGKKRLHCRFLRFLSKVTPISRHTLRCD